MKKRLTFSDPSDAGQLYIGCGEECILYCTWEEEVHPSSSYGYG